MLRKRAQRRITLLVALMFLFSVLAPALALGATPSDVAGTKYEGAVNRLQALNILTGYPDGTFKPGNNITRAEFAAVAIRALGLEQAAGYAKGPTAFSDVSADHWASGYINVASSQGIIKGYPDGTFKPDANVTYAEALAMVLRALGYEPTLTGTWPVKYLVKAAELGITKGVTFSANTPATRGDVAAFVDNSLTVAKVVQVGFGDQAKYVVSGTDPSVPKTTLLNNLGATAVEGVLIDSPEIFGVAADVVKVWADANGNGNIDTSGTSNEVTELKLVSGAAYKGLLGHKVKAWKNADGKVFFIEDLTAADKVKTAKWDGSTLKIGTETLSLAAGTPQKVVNFQRSDLALSGANAPPATVDNGEVTVILNDDGKVTWLTATSLTTRVVDSVSTGFQSIAFSGGGTLSVKDKTLTYVGAASKLEEIQKDDVVEYAEATVGGKTYLYIVVTRNSKTGEFSRLVDGTPDKVTVAGVEYSGASGFNADDNLLGKQVTVLLNKHGKVVAMKAVTTDTKIIAAVKGNPYTVTTAAGSETYVRVLKADGTEARLKVADGATIDDSDADTDPDLTFDVDTMDYNDLTGAGISDLAIIEYSLNADGALRSASVLVAASDTGVSNLDVYKDYNQIEITDGGSRALVVSSTAIFDVRTAGDPKVVTAARLMGDTGGLTGRVVLTKTGSGVAKVVAIKGNFDVPAATTYGLVVSKYQTSGPKYYLGINVNGAVTDYEVTVGRFVYNVDDVVTFSPVDAKNTVTGATQLTVSDAVYVWKVQEIDSANKLVYIDEYHKDTGVENPTDQRKAILILADTQVFNLNGDNPATLARFEDIAVGQEVRVYYDAAAPGVAKVFVIVK